MSLDDELKAAAESAQAFLEIDEELAGVMAAEPSAELRVYLCAYRRQEETLSWLALDADGRPLADRAVLRDTVSIVGLCEIAEESAGGGDLPALRRQLAELRVREHPAGIEEAELAAEELEGTIATEPRVASIAYLDAIGEAATRLERALGEMGSSPFARAMSSSSGALDELADDVERNYKGSLG